MKMFKATFLVGLSYKKEQTVKVCAQQVVAIIIQRVHVYGQPKLLLVAEYLLM